jgi:hypothetical protein
MASSDAALTISVYPSKEWDIENLGLETTPLIRAALDVTCSRFSLKFVRMMVGVFIDNDFAHVFDATSFTPHGDDALQHVLRAHAGLTRLQLSATASPAASSRDPGRSGYQSLHLAIGGAPKALSGTRQQSMVAVVKKRKLEVARGDSFASPQDVGKAEEIASKALAAQELLMVLPLDCRERLCPGGSKLDTVSCGSMAVFLVLALTKMGAADTLRNCRRELARFGSWLERNYAIDHGFAIEPGILLHYLASRLIGEGHAMHVPAQAKDGLVFAEKNLLLSIPIQHSVVVAFCRCSHKLAQSAVSTSCAMFMLYFHFATSKVRGKWAYPFSVRYVAACLLVWCIAAIRSIDCQRAKLLGEGPDGSTKLYLTAACWDSKKKCAFIWLVPLKIFGSSDWVPTLHLGWRKNDFMFCQFDVKKGTALFDMPDTPGIVMDRPATPYMVQKWIRELYSATRVTVDTASKPSGGPGALMSSEDAASTTRYGNRHFASNVVRCGDASLWPADVRRRVSGWGAIKEMPDRYSQETADLDNYKIRIAILDMVWKAVKRTPISDWPAFGGWHLFSSKIPTSAKSLVSVHEHHGKDVDVDGGLLFGDDCAGSDFDDVSDEDEGEGGEAPVRGLRGKAVPPGWSAVVGNLSSGAAYTKHYLHTATGVKLRSIKEIMASIKEALPPQDCP